MTKTSKAKKPRRGFPLWLHPSGQWCKKVRGKFYYFGTDAADAEARWDLEKPDLLAGKPVERTRSDTLSVRQIANLFLTAKRTAMNMGTLAPRTFNDYHNACGSLVEFFKDRTAASLKPADFSRFLVKLTETRGLVALGNSILRTRIIFRWAFENEHIEKPVKFGTEFRQPTKTALRRAKTGGRTFAADELRKILDAANQPLKAMILLGLNCAFGQTDVANLPLDAMDLAGGWVRFPRPKTAIPRRAPLWPETVAALREAIEQRPDPKDATDAGLVFLTQRGARWVRSNLQKQMDGQIDDNRRIVFTDAVGQEFKKVLDRLKLKRRGSFYNLRHCFATQAAMVNDRDAINVVMGHSDPSMGANYIDRFPDARLRGVTDCVHDWLFPATTATAPEANASTTDGPAVLPFRATAG